MDTNLEPATSIIAAFGGRQIVCEITGLSRTRVYRWTQPKDKGGTDGLIPVDQAVKLLRYAKENGIAVTAEQFLSVATIEEAAQ